MADLTRYLDCTLGSGANDGTSPTDAFKTWAAFVAAVTDIVASGFDNYVLKVKNAGVSNITLGSGWVTNASHRLIIEGNDVYSAADGGRHEGLYSAGAGTDLGSGDSLIIRGASGPTHVTIRGLRVTSTTGGSGPGYGVVISNTGTIDWIIEGCLLTAGAYRCVEVAGPTGGTVKIKNCVMRDSYDHGIFMNASGVTLYVHNCTLFDCGTGWGVSGINNAAATDYETKDICVTTANRAASPNDFEGTFSSPSYGNISRDVAAPAVGGTSQTSITDNAALFENAGADDYRIKSTSVAVGVGRDLTGDSNLAVTDDFILNTRVAPLDVGAHQVSVVAPSVPPIESFFRLAVVPVIPKSVGIGY